MPQAIRVPSRIAELTPTPGASGTVPVSQGAGLDPVWQAVAGVTQGYIHDQAVPSATWTVNHGLPFYPNVTIIDTLNREVIGDVSYPSPTQVVIGFSASFSGKAVLS